MKKKASQWARLCKKGVRLGRFGPAYLTQARFFVFHVFARDRVKLFNDKFFRVVALVFGGGVKVASASGGFQLNLFAYCHNNYLSVMGLNDFATVAKIAKNCIDSILINETQAPGGNTQPHPTVFTFYPKPAILKVGQKTTACFIVCMGNVIARHRALAGYLAYASHGNTP